MNAAELRSWDHRLSVPALRGLRWGLRVCSAGSLSAGHVVLFYPRLSDFSQISSGVTNLHESAGRTKVCGAVPLPSLNTPALSQLM